MNFSSWCVSAKPIQISAEAEEVLRSYLQHGQEEHELVLVRERNRNTWLSSRRGTNPSPSSLSLEFCQAWVGLAGSADPQTRHLYYTFAEHGAEGETFTPGSAGCEVFVITMQGVKKRAVTA